MEQPQLKSETKDDANLKSGLVEDPDLKSYQATTTSTTSYFKRSNTLYDISKVGTSSPIIIRDLNIQVFPKRTVRAKYILKFQTSNPAWAPSFGFLGVNKETDNLMGTGYWPMVKGGGSSTTYSFMTDNPRFYSNNGLGVADSNVPFAEVTNKNIFNSIVLDIEYTNGNTYTTTLSLEFNRDLYAWPGQTQRIIEGSSVEYVFY